MFEYDHGSKAAAEKLDRHDLTSVLNQCHGRNIYDVLDDLDDMGIAEVSEAIEYLTSDEIIDYLRERYRGKLHITEVVRYDVYWNNQD